MSLEPNKNLFPADYSFLIGQRLPDGADQIRLHWQLAQSDHADPHGYHGICSLYGDRQWRRRRRRRDHYPAAANQPGEIMSGGEGEPIEADAPAEDETVAPQGTHVTSKQTVTHEYLRKH